MLTYPQQLAVEAVADGEALDARVCLAFAERDADAIAACLAGGATPVVLPDGSALRGRAALRAALDALFARHAAVALTLDAGVRHAAGECTLTVGAASCVLRAHDGEETRLALRWSDLRRRVDGCWEYLLVHVAPLGHDGREACGVPHRHPSRARRARKGERR